MKKLLIVAIIASLFLTACFGPQPGDEMVFEEEEIAEEEEMAPEDEEVVDDEVVDEDSMLFEESEVSPFTPDALPPSGQWTLTQTLAELICEPDLVEKIDIAPPVIGSLVLSDDTKTIILTTPDGAVPLTQDLVTTNPDFSVSLYSGSIAFDEGRVEYYLEYNLLGDGSILGTRTIFIDGEACKTEIGFKGEYIEP